MLRFSRKAVLLVLAVALIAFSFSALPSFAASAITSAEFVIGMNQYFVNNQVPGVSMDAAAYIDSASGRTLAPVRYLADALGATTNWDANTQTVTVSTSVYNISMTIGSATLTVNGQGQTMDVAPVISNSRTYLPARWVSNALGYQVDWNAANQIVIIWPNGTTEPDYSNVTSQAQQKPTVVNGFTIPTGTNLDIKPVPAIPGDAIMEFVVDGSKGNVQGQLNDAQNILSQSQYLDPATVSAAMTMITSLTTVQNPTMKDDVVWNSPNGGSISVGSSAFGMNKGYCWVGVRVFPIQMQPSKYYTIE